MDLKPGFALCPLPPPAPNVEYTHEECGAKFFTDETGEFWMHRWCDLHGKPDDCSDALQRIYSFPEYQRQTALVIREIQDNKEN